jgi:parallel beta-helix repeat protein
MKSINISIPLLSIRRNKCMKKAIVCILVCLLMILTAVGPASAATLSEKIAHPLNRGKILYVGGSGPNNYTKIQDAINVAANGDMVFVYDDSSPYFEAVHINRSISLIGEGKLTTIIDVRTIKNTSALNISADGVLVQGVTIQNSTNAAGIFIAADNVLIKENIIKDNSVGIQVGGRINYTLYVANHCIIEDNDIMNNIVGISLDHGNYSTISHNHISVNEEGIDVQNCNSNLITLNEITENNGAGIFLVETTNNSILQNNITGNHDGFDLFDSSKNSIQQNNIYKNGIHNVWAFSIMFISLRTKSRPFDNSWDGNYWGRAYQFPKPIFGFLFFLFPSLILSGFLQPLKLLQMLLTGSGGYLVVPLGIPSVKFDWHPAQNPYDIPVLG